MKLVLSIVLLLGFACHANAGLITFEFQGTIEHSFSVYGDVVNVGDAFVASFTFDEETVDAFSANPFLGSYSQSAGLGINVQAGDAVFYSSANVSPSSLIGNGGLAITVTAGPTGSLVFQSGSGATDTPRIQIFLLNPTDQGLPSDELPTSIDLTLWKDAVMFVTGPSLVAGVGESAFRDISGPIQSVRVINAEPPNTVVPEPTTAIIWVVFGVVAILTRACGYIRRFIVESCEEWRGSKYGKRLLVDIARA